MPDEYDTGVVTKVKVPSYRGIENPFGHVWSWTDGCKCAIESDADGGVSSFYTCDNPANFQDTNYDNYVKRGELPRKEGYVKRMMIGEYGEICYGSGRRFYYLLCRLLLYQHTSQRRSTKGCLVRRSCALRRECRAFVRGFD